MPDSPRRTAAAATVLAIALAGVALPGAGSAAALTASPRPGSTAPAAAAIPLTNLAHLDFLGDTVRPPAQEGHTTYRLDAEPDIGVLWTYAEPDGTGGWRRLGGGAYDPATNTYEQGAYNADDISRAAVVYLRHWRQFRDANSRTRARELLRGLTYLQTSSGPNRGNTVLWMQPDGTLNPSPVPVEQPDPSDSGPSFWLARSIWALGEGYAAFRTADPEFAGFLRQRLGLALDALDRQVLDPKYGHYQTVDGLKWPDWLIVDGADASSEAVYGLAAYVRAGGGTRARRELGRLADGIAQMPLGGTDRWPFGAVMPYALSRSIWHAYLDQMSGALATAGAVLHRPAYTRVAVGEVARFTPHLLVQGGPDNYWGPAPIDRTQIAYGADATVQNLLSTARATGLGSFRSLAGVAASWYFGNNRPGVQMYDPATGVTFDGINNDGAVNRNSGAESTIHGLLSMLALDAAPDVAARAQVANRRGTVTWQLTEAESGTLSGAATVVTPDDSYTGESSWSGGSYVKLGPGGSVRATVSLPVGGNYLLMPVFLRRQAAAGAVGTTLALGGVSAGRVDQGGAGPQGVTAIPGFLDIATARVRGPVAAGTRSVLATYAGTGTAARLDAVLVQPDVEWQLLSGPGARGAALLRSFATTREVRRIPVPGSGTATVRSYDTSGRLVSSTQVATSSVAAPVAPGGFTIVTR